MFQKTTGRTIEIGGQSYLYFAGTSYLGLHVNVDWHRLLIEGNALYGTHYGGSRLFRHVPDVYEQVETMFRAQTGQEAAVLCSSGTLAGQLLRQQVPSGAGKIYFRAHPSVGSFIAFDSVKTVHSSMELLKQVEQQEGQKEIWIFTNSVYPTLGEPSDWRWLAALPADKRIHLVIDDSHGIGILGAEGHGVFSLLPSMPDNVDITLFFSLGKAFSTPGAIIAGDIRLIQSIKRHPMWGGASPPPPGPLYALVKGGEIAQTCRQRLRYLIAQAEQLASSLGGIHLKGFPVFMYEMVGLAAYLKAKGVILSSFHYPTPESPLVSRVVLNSSHKVEDLVQTYGYIDNFRNKG